MEEERERQSGASFTWSGWDDLSSHIHDLQVQVDGLQTRLENSGRKAGPTIDIIQEVEQELNIIAREMDQEMNIVTWEMGWRTRTRNVKGKTKSNEQLAELRAGA